MKVRMGGSTCGTAVPGRVGHDDPSSPPTTVGTGLAVVSAAVGQPGPGIPAQAPALTHPGGTDRDRLVACHRPLVAPGVRS